MSPILFIPGLLCSAEIFGPQLNALWRLGPVMVASTLEASTIGDAAAKILETAPPRFSLAGLSMGGYICFEIMRQAPLDPPRRRPPDLEADISAQRKSGGSSGSRSLIRRQGRIRPSSRRSAGQALRKRGPAAFSMSPSGI